MRSFQNTIKNFERHYGVHFKSLRRSRRFMTLLFISLFTLIYVLYKIAPRSRRTGYFTTELDFCMHKSLDKFSNDIKLMNAAVTDGDRFISYSNSKLQTNDESTNEPLDDLPFFLPYTGNGYIGLSIKSDNGMFLNFHKSMNLKLFYNPLVQIYSDRLKSSETTVTDFKRGMAHLLQCYQFEKKCVSIQNSLYAHRIRPSLLIEEVTLNNPTKESITFNILQMGDMNWNHSKTRIENINGEEFTISSGMIDVVSNDHTKTVKHLCLSIGTTRLPTTLLLKEHEFFQKLTVITVVKYSLTLLGGKMDNLDPILDNLENQVKQEINEVLRVGYNQLKKEHINAWDNIWTTGFSISNSLATGAINGNQINGTMYYLLTNNQVPLLEINHLGNSTVAPHSYHTERCYEGFSTLHAVKLWKLPKNELEVAETNNLWALTLQKHGCGNLLNLGAEGILQAVVLSLGGFKFTNHHLDLNLNPRQLHRDYVFRKINYGNMSLLTVDVEVGYDNHAVLYVTLNKLLDQTKHFYACDAGCIDPPVELKFNVRQEFPVKLTNPITAILYISEDKDHINDLKHALHVQEVDIAPPQDVNSIAIHKHGHHMAGFATLFWTIFISLILIFHLFLIKLVYRELCQGGIDESSSQSSRRYRYARTV